MRELSWREIRRIVYERAHGCCEYCQTCDYNTGQPMHVDHIDPDDGDELDNLCLACPSCNQSKFNATQATDPLTGELVPLFNSRKDYWHEHFAWLDPPTHLLGKTAVGRATIDRLKINQDRMVRARRNWLIAGNHPPSA